MRVYACFLLVGISAYTHSSAPNTPGNNKRSVNLALETVLEFNEKDKASDIKFLDNVQNFITKVKTVIGKNNNAKTGFRRDFKAPTVDTFTGFIQEVVNILDTYDNTTFTDFFEVLDDEIRKYHYRGCKFYELTENNEIRKFIAAKLDLMRRTPTSVIKSNINTLSETLKNQNFDKNIKEIFDYINSLYRQDARGKFQKVLTELELHGKSNSKSNTRLGDIVKNGVRSIIFDHYTKLNTNVRRDVKQKMETFWKQYNEYTPSMGNTPNARTSDTIMKEVKKSKHTVNAEVKQNVGTKRDDVKHDTKRKKHTRKDAIDGPAKVLQKGKRIPSPQHTGTKVQEMTKNERQEQSNSLSSDSLEFYHQPKEDTQQNKSDKISNKMLTNSRKKSKKIEAVNPTTRIPAHNKVPNIWIEESTGRLPKEVLDKLSIKARGHNMTKAVSKHAPEHNKKYNKGQKSWHGKMYEPKLDTKRMRKHRSKNSLNESRSNESSKPFDLKLHQYKKSMGPMGAKLNKTDRLSSGATKTLKFLDVLDVLKIPAKSGKAIKPHRGNVAANKLAGTSKTKGVEYDAVRRIKATRKTSVDQKPLKRLPKNNIMISRKSGTQFAKSLEHPSSSSEGMTVEQMEIKNDKTSEYKSQRKVASLEKDLYVIRKIKNLEKELEEVKSKMNDKAKVKLSEPTENKEMRSLPETKTGSDVNNDSKIDKLETAGTVDNKTMLININKDIEKVASKYNDVKDNGENGKLNNVYGDFERFSTTLFRFRELQQSTEPGKIKRKLSKLKPRPLIDRSIIGSIPRQDKLEIIGTEHNKNGSVIDNTYVQHLVSKYEKLMKGFENGKSKVNVNADEEEVRENIRDFALTETAKTTNEVLLDSVKDKDSKNIVEGKKSDTLFRSEIDLIPNEFMKRKEKAKVTRIADYQKNLTEKEKNSQNNETNFKIDKDKPTTKQMTSYFESVRDESLKMIKTAGNKKGSLNKSVSVSDFQSIKKDKNPETIFRSDVNLITNDFKDKTEVEKVTRIGNIKSDTNKKAKNKVITGNVQKVKSRIDFNDNEVKVRELQQNTEPNKVKRKLVKAKPRPLVDSYTIPGLEPLQIPGIEDKTVLRVKNNYFNHIASNYDKFMAELERKKNKNKVYANALRAGNAYESQGNQRPIHKLVTIPAIDAERMFKSFEQAKNKLIKLTKMKSSKPPQVSGLNTKVNNTNQGVNPGTSLQSDGSETASEAQNRTEKTKVIETTDSKTALIEIDKIPNKTEKAVDKHFQNIVVTKEQLPIMKEEKKTNVTLNIGGVTPEMKPGGTQLIKHRTVDDATKGTEDENREIESTSALSKATESTIRDTVTVVVTTPTTYELSTIEVFLSGATPSQSPLV